MEFFFPVVITPNVRSKPGKDFFLIYWVIFIEQFPCNRKPTPTSSILSPSEEISQPLLPR